VFPEGEEERTLDAVAVLLREQLVEPVLLGSPDTIRSRMEDRGVSPSDYAVTDPSAPESTQRWSPQLLRRRKEKGMSERQALKLSSDPLICGALMVAEGEVDGSVAGAVHPTGAILRAALWAVGTAEGIETVSSSFYMVVPPFRGGSGEVLTFTDGGVVPTPTPQQLADIALAAARARSRIVGDEPRLAFLSYSTLGSAHGPAVDLVREALALFREKAPEVAADGEFQADAALIESVGQRKAAGSAVAGSANVLVFPDLDAANISYKLVQRLAGADAIGPIVQGLRRPCNDLSRGASVADVVSVACVTSLMAD
jgi:phosphate acetyltransferase